MEIRYLLKNRQIPEDLELEISDITGLRIIVNFPDSIRLLRKCTLDNGYGEYFDLHGNKYFVTPDAEKLSREYWTGVEVDKDFYIYQKEE